MATRSTLVHTSSFDLSYATMIRQVLAGGLTIGNVTHYGVTTHLHQYKCGCASCDVLLDNVPVGCSDLLSVALERGVVVVRQWRTESMPAHAFEYTLPTSTAIPSVA